MPSGQSVASTQRTGGSASGRFVEDVDRLFGVGAEDDDDRVAAAGGHGVDGPVQPGRAVRVADQCLGLTHPAALTRGQQNADRRRPGRLTGVEGTLHERMESRRAPSRTLRTGSAFNYLPVPGPQNGHIDLKRGDCPATGPQVRTTPPRRRRCAQVRD